MRIEINYWYNIKPVCAIFIVLDDEGMEEEQVRME